MRRLRSLREGPAIDRQRDSSIRKHHPLVTGGRESSEVVKGGDERQAIIDQCSQCLPKVECRERIEPVEGFVQDDQRLPAREG